MSIGTKSIEASSLASGMWIVYDNPRYRERVVDVQETRDGQIRVSHDFGNGGEPAASFYEPSDRLTVI